MMKARPTERVSSIKVLRALGKTGKKTRKCSQELSKEPYFLGAAQPERFAGQLAGKKCRLRLLLT